MKNEFVHELLQTIDETHLDPHYDALIEAAKKHLRRWGPSRDEL